MNLAAACNPPLILNESTPPKPSSDCQMKTKTLSQELDEHATSKSNVQLENGYGGSTCHLSPCNVVIRMASETRIIDLKTCRWRQISNRRELFYNYFGMCKADPRTVWANFSPGNEPFQLQAYWTNTVLTLVRSGFEHLRAPPEFSCLLGYV